MFRLPPRLVLAAAAALVAVCLAAPVPVLDEESYLDIARQLDVARPYDWWRAWQPWGDSREADAFVYAHPPLFLLWVKLWIGLGGDGLPVRALKAAAALPWAMLLGWSAGRLAERVARRPWQAAAVWLTAPITVLGLQRGLMPDLMTTALTSFAVVSWLEGHGQQGGLRARWLAFAGVALGLAGATKYPALILVLPLLLHGARVGRLRSTWPAWLSLAVVWLGVEGWLFSSYGRVHLVEVLARAGEIGRGSATGRLLGVLSRLGLLGLPVLPLLLWPWRRDLLPAIAGGGAMALFGTPTGTPMTHRVGLGLLAAAALLMCGVAVRAAAGQSIAGKPVDRTDGDGLLLGSWALAVLAGVVLTHNYAAPRYLLPAVLPMAILLARQVERRLDAVATLVGGCALMGMLALGVTLAEHRFSDAQVSAADAAVDAAIVSGFGMPGRFSGEWTFRWRMEQRGWSWWDGSDLPSGTTVISATQSVPREIPADWTEVANHRRGRLWLRVVHAEAGVALYSETIGALPLGGSPGMLEEAVTWTSP